MAYGDRRATLSQHGAAFAIVGLLHTALLTGLTNELAVRGPPKFPGRQKWPAFWLAFPPLPPCLDCTPRPPEPPYPPFELVREYRATPSNAPSQWLTVADYPAFDLQKGHQGMTTFNLDVDRRGKVTACKITASSGFASLDEAACRKIRLRARFKPATDETGKPVLGIYTNRVRWTIPHQTCEC